MLSRYWEPEAEPVLPDNPDKEFWQRVQEQALVHRVANQLYKPVAAQPDLLPDESRHWLGFVHSMPIMRYGHWQPTVKEVLAALNDAGIECLVLKGWWFLEAFFDGDFGLRPANDLDLLLHREDMPRAEEVLAALDIHPGAPDLWPGFKLRYLHEQAYQKQYDGKIRFIVELHWGIGFDIPAFDHVEFNDWYGRALETEILGVPAKVPAPEDLFVYLCGHLHLQHSDDQAKLLRYMDLALLAKGEMQDGAAGATSAGLATQGVVQDGTEDSGVLTGSTGSTGYSSSAARDTRDGKPDPVHRVNPVSVSASDSSNDGLDWDAVLERSQAWHLSICLQKSVDMLVELWPGLIDADLHKRVGKMTPTPDEKRFMDLVLDEGSPTFNRFVHFRALPGLVTKIRFALEWLFPGPTYMCNRYCPNHPWLLPLAYPRRLFDGLAFLFRRK